MTAAIYGFVGALALVAWTAASLYAGWTLHKRWQDNLHPELKPLQETERARLKAQAEAQAVWSSYSADMAYGVAKPQGGGDSE